MHLYERNCDLFRKKQYWVDYNVLYVICIYILRTWLPRLNCSVKNGGICGFLGITELQLFIPILFKS